MAQLYFRYGAMNSGKSIEIIKVAHNYEEQGKSVIIMTSALDTREDFGTVASRVGLQREAEVIFDNSNVFEMVNEVDPDASCILVDEAQFLKREHVRQLTRIVDEMGIPVIAFGLKNDFQNNLFEGSQALLEYADKIEEMKTICWFCGRKAIMNMRIHVCRFHYYSPDLTLVDK